MPTPMVIILFYPKHVQFGEEIIQSMLVIFCEELKQDSVCSKGSLNDLGLSLRKALLYSKYYIVSNCKVKRPQ